MCPVYRATTPSADASSTLDPLIERLIADLSGRSSILVAYSGGVDSVTVAALAHRAVGERALAVTAAAETLAGMELDWAREQAAAIGIQHEITTYSELDNPEFVRNPKYRCYVCQGMRMDRMLQIAADRGYERVCDGTNASDPGPDRPGLEAIREREVYSPLLAHDVDKDTVRRIAHRLGLEAWDRPSNACLSSRIPHGQVVTLGKLRRVEQAEELLARHGFLVVRVRHQGTLARVEVGQLEIERLSGMWQEIAPAIQSLGFDDVVFDERGYRTGGADDEASRQAAALPT